MGSGAVSIRVQDTERPDAWEVHGRGELQLVVLLELMRREGFEIVASQPQVLTREVKGKLCEPVDRLAIDVPEDYVGVVTQMLALRKGGMEQMINHSTGWVRLDYLAPARGLIGFRTEFLTETRGTGILHHVFEAWEPWAGDLRSRPTGALVSDRPGETASFALHSAPGPRLALRRPRRGRLRGHDRGENSRSDDLDVNATKQKHQTNIRAASRRHPRPPDPTTRALAGERARVPARGRVRRDHPREPAAAQGRALEGRADEDR